ncbi:hypothetical protein LPJ63_000872 [Coemansia sp. RSA 2711]|nr:hypothetical protein LPJ63_000872 [Coemansia sp. RSA 2711]
MARIQLSSLDEFVASLSRLDYEAAKVASGKVMEDHIRMGALMFSLLTIEMMYTSMDYLTPENYRRGNSYLLNMYSPLPRQLNKLLRKLVSEYEEEHQRLLSLNAQAASRGSAVHSLYDTTTHGSVHDLGSQSGLAGDNDASRRRLFASQTIHLNGSGSQHANSEATSGSRLGSSGSGSNKLHSEHRKQAANIGTARPATEYHTKGIQTGRGTAEPFDPNQYLANMEEAEVVLKELETVRQFVEFITKFVEVRKTMVVLYRFVAVTGPVLYVPKLRVMLDSCKDIIQAIEPNPLYASLLEHMRYEIWLVSSLVDWNSHVIAYDIVQAVTHMKKAKQLLRTWQDTLPAHDRPEAGSSRRSTGGHSIYESIGDAIGGRRDRDAGAGQPASHGLLYTALAKSSRMVQNLLWRGGGLGSGDDAQSQSADGMRGIIIWVNAWFDYLSFKTTIFFQQIIAPYRSLYHDDMTVHAKQAAVMSDTWSRPGVAKTNLYEIVSEFMQANDGCFVALLFESSKQRPFAADGFAIAGTKVDVPDYRVQACAVLFCFANQRLLRSRGISVKDTLVHDVHANRPDPATRGTEAQQQSEVEWFRQNCLPDILYVLDSDRATLDYELLGSSPLLNRLGADADELLVELCDSVHDTVEEAIAQLAISKEAENARLVAERGAHSAAMGDLQPGTAKSHSGQASEALRLSAMKTLSSADQRQQQQHMSTQSESARHSPSIHSMPGNDHASTSDSHQYLNAPDGVSRSTAAMMASSSGSGMELHRAQVTSRPSAQPAPVRASPENELMRRVRCGERLHELFGSWGEDKPDDVPEDGSAQRVGEHRPSSIHSLSFSAPTRASLGGRAGMATDTANYGANATPAALEAEGIGGRFVLRLPRTTDRAQQEHVQRKSSRPPATRRASEFGLGTAVEFLQNRSQPPRPPHEQPAKPQHLPHVAPHAGHQPTTPTTSGAEGYTYLYSRVGLPNVVLVAVILDSDKGLDRRREAEHAWDSVVDAVRGAPLFEQLMALSG